MGTIEKLTLETVEKASGKFVDDPIYKEFDKANKDFNLLVEKGITSRRGYNLISIEESKLRRFSFNSI
jgi:hypothetical protein